MEKRTECMFVLSLLPLLSLALTLSASETPAPAAHQPLSAGNDRRTGKRNTNRTHAARGRNALGE
jgi:hypothetical protein